MRCAKEMSADCVLEAQICPSPTLLPSVAAKATGGGGGVHGSAANFQVAPKSSQGSKCPLPNLAALLQGLHKAR